MAATSHKVAVAGTLVLSEIKRVKDAVEQDRKYGTTRNRAEAGVSIITAVKGAVDGFAAGAKVGAFFGVGAFVCGAIGAVCGAVSCAYVGREAAAKIFDNFKYDIKKFKCRECGVVYECRVYTDQSRFFCPGHAGGNGDKDFKKIYKCTDCGKKYSCSLNKSLDLCPRCKEDDDPGYFGSRMDYPDYNHSGFTGSRMDYPLYNRAEFDF